MAQLPRVKDTYGAPKGRKEFGRPNDSEKRNVRLFRVRLNSGGYDDGGAYWGTGSPLWCADGADDDGPGEFFQFTRANTRREAAERLGVTHRLIKRA